MLVAERMTKNPVTVSAGTPIPDALKLMRDKRVRRLPVIDDKGKLVGIITETDLFKTFLELLGGREHGVRITLLVPEKKGILASLTRSIAEQGGNIISLGTFLGDDPTNRQITVKVADAGRDHLVQVLQDIAVEITDVRVV